MTGTFRIIEMFRFFIASVMQTLDTGLKRA